MSRSVERAESDLIFLRETLIPRLEENLRWAKAARYFKLRHVDPSDEVRTNDVSDPTGELVVGQAQERMKAAVNSTTRLIESAVEDLEAADKAIDDAFKKADQLYERVDNKITKPLVDEGELERAREAQRRRQVTGRGYGQS